MLMIEQLSKQEREIIHGIIKSNIYNDIGVTSTWHYWIFIYSY